MPGVSARTGGLRKLLAMLVRSVEPADVGAVSRADTGNEECRVGQLCDAAAAKAERKQRDRCS